MRHSVHAVSIKKTKTTTFVVVFHGLSSAGANSTTHAHVSAAADEKPRLFHYTNLV
jgi:hypothetical protein